jgi:hypothetical protein
VCSEGCQVALQAREVAGKLKVNILNCSLDEIVRIAEAAVAMDWSLTSRGIFTGGILKTVFCAVRRTERLTLQGAKATPEAPSV